MTLYNSSWPIYTNDMINGVSQILQSGKVNQWTGKYVKQFETEFANYFGMQHAIAVTNGTVSLELAIKCLDITIDDEVIVTSRSFIASANQVAMIGATPVFADVDITTQNMTAKMIEEKITSKTRAVILVHLAGFPCDMEPIMKLCNQHNIIVIEDCAQAHGAKYNNQYVGTFGKVSSWSFCQDKIISTGGEGGLLLTNDTDLYKRMWSYKDHGKDYNLYQTPFTNNGLYNYTCRTLGTNYRMTEISAFIGLESLKLLSQWLLIRQSHAEILNNKLSKLNTIYLSRIDSYNYEHAYYKYYFHLKNDYINHRNNILLTLISKGISASQGSCGRLYDEICLQQFKTNTLSNSETLMDNSIMIPLDPSFDKNQIESITNIIYDVLLQYE